MRDGNGSRGGHGSRVGARRHTACSRLAGVLSVSLAVTVGGLRSTAAPAPWVAVLVGAVVLGGTAAGVKLWRDNCFESRLVVVVLSVLTAIGQTLDSTVGAPGGHPVHWRAGAVLVVALAVAIPLLVLRDTRSRARNARHERPYAL